MTTQFKFKKGDTVVYENVIATVEKCWVTHGGDKKMVSLISRDDEEMSCSAPESEVSLYVENEDAEYENEKALSDARVNSKMIAMQVDSITDKYYGDGSF